MQDDGEKAKRRNIRIFPYTQISGPTGKKYAKFEQLSADLKER